MGIPRIYRKSRENTVLNYDFADIAEGTGIVLFYGYVDADATGNNYKFSTRLFDSRLIESNDSGTWTTTAFVKDLDIDFDLGEQTVSRVIQGKATIETAWDFEKTAGGNDIQGYIKYILKRVRGGAETIIGTGQSETFSVMVTGTHDKRIVLINIDVTKTSLKKGDMLRLTQEGWGRINVVGNSTGKFTIVHDPLNRDGTVITPTTDDRTTQLKVYMPFRIE